MSDNNLAPIGDRISYNQRSGRLYPFTCREYALVINATEAYQLKHLFIVILLALAGCTQDKADAVSAGGWVDSITPTADGGAYAVKANGLWYMKGSRYEAVTGAEFGILTEIVPLTDGTAYASTMDHIYHLNGGVATPLTETPGAVASSESTQGDPAYFAQWAAERGKASRDERDRALLSSPRYDY